MITESQLKELGFIDGNDGYRATGSEVVYKKGEIELWFQWPDKWAVLRKGKPRIIISDIEELKTMLDE